MDSSSAQQHHHQEMGLQTLESMLACNKSQQAENKKPRPADMQALKCPRCDSTNTKFCYYNNYSLSQPRYFCKSCRRYWTKGGTLRNVPVGGGCRKNKRSSSSSPSSSKRSQDQPVPTPLPSMAHLSYNSNDLNLAIANSGHLGLEDRDFSIWGNTNMTQHHQHHGDGLRSFGGGGASSSGLFDAIRSGAIDNHSGGYGMQNLYYGGNGEVDQSGGMGISGAHEMGMPSLYEEYGGSGASTAVKQEICGSGEDGDGRILWGFPWQNMSNEDENVSNFHTARLNWSGIGSSNWQGLLNSPLT